MSSLAIGGICGSVESNLGVEVQDAKGIEVHEHGGFAETIENVDSEVDLVISGILRKRGGKHGKGGKKC